MRLLALVCAAVVACQAEPKDSGDESAGETFHVALEESLPAMDGERLSVTAVEVTYAPGGSSPPHSHGCPVIGYVADGSLRFRVGDGPETVYDAGTAFYESANESHLVSANASESEPVTFVALFVCAEGAPLSTPIAP